MFSLKLNLIRRTATAIQTAMRKAVCYESHKENGNLTSIVVFGGSSSESHKENGNLTSIVVFGGSSSESHKENGN